MKDYTFTIKGSEPVENTQTGQHLWAVLVKTAYGELMVTIPGKEKPSEAEVEKVVRKAIDERP